MPIGCDGRASHLFVLLYQPLVDAPGWLPRVGRRVFASPLDQELGLAGALPLAQHPLDPGPRAKACGCAWLLTRLGRRHLAQVRSLAGQGGRGSADIAKGGRVDVGRLGHADAQGVAAALLRRWLILFLVLGLVLVGRLFRGLCFRRFIRRWSLRRWLRGRLHEARLRNERTRAGALRDTRCCVQTLTLCK